MVFVLLLDNEAPNLAEMKTKYSLQSISCLETISVSSLQSCFPLSPSIFSFCWPHRPCLPCTPVAAEAYHILLVHYS